MEKAYLFKIKAGKSSTWEAWCNELASALKNEAIETLKEEKVQQELSLSFSLNGEGYVIGFMDGECLPANMNREINQQHKKMREECLERVGDVGILYNIRNDQP